MLLSRFVIGIFSVGLVGLGADGASGQDYPNKSIRMLTAAAGGSSDIVARIVAQGFTDSLGQPVVVDNRTSLIASEVVSKARA